MNPLAFRQKLKRLESQLADAERLRKEFDEFKRQVHGHADSTKEIISTYLDAARGRYEKDILQIQKDMQFCQQVFKADRAVLEQGLRERSQGFPSLAKAHAEYLTLRADQIAAWFGHKSHPARKAAEVVRDMRAERQALAQKCKILEYTVLYYEELFPALADYREIDNPDETEERHADGDEDPVKRWLSEDEYRRLPEVDRCQIAQDRYWKREKSPWQLGRDYERYVGYDYEKKGYDVGYEGIIKGFKDGGRDLICRKGEEYVIVQCKYWAQGKVVHEKHVGQLFGSCVKFWVEQTKGRVSQIELFPDVLKSHRIVPCFITSTVLSPEAKDWAKALGVHVVENFTLKPYPCIKCNVSRMSGAHIYHLPFDQQYDSTLVEAERHECYVATVREAEQRGFRRAWKWRGPDK